MIQAAEEANAIAFIKGGEKMDGHKEEEKEKKKGKGKESKKELDYV